MSTTRTVAAIDLGAESGRVASVTYDGKSLDLSVEHRFSHEPFRHDGVLRWDLPRIQAEISAGLGKLSRGSERIWSVGADTWGVDYGLLGVDDRLVDLPTCYRDARQVRAMHEAMDTVGGDALYLATGVQIIPINTVFGLMADLRDHPGRIEAARTLLMMPDVIHHSLCGSTTTEYTAASTSGAYDMAGRRWSSEVLRMLDIPERLMPEVVPPGTDVGALAEASGALVGARVIVPPGHDTASAVVGVPFASPGAMFISSGTWSLVGVETERAIVSEASLRANLTNEGGYGDTVRLLRNVMGLWILQECRRQWAKEGSDLSYPEIVALAEREPGLRSLIATDSNLFLGAGDMPGRIRGFCEQTGMPVPETVGQVARCIFDSLALSYASVADDVATVTGTRPPAVNIVGGGASNALLSQLTADATGVPVYCGPVEATALGNAGVQLAALGEFDDLGQIREAIGQTADIVVYDPRVGRDWAAAAQTVAALPRLEPPDSG